MSYVADLHTHSRFARACSPALNIPNLSSWGKTKGINLLGTGDFLHPLWLAELKKDLIEDGSGFLSYPGSDTKFVLSVELASIYTEKGKGRKVHNVIIMPSLKSVEKLQKALLDRKINLSYDGRPIIGKNITCKNLLQILLEIDEKVLMIPAHVWTPWFGIFGSKSGYDSLSECFEDLTKYVYAIETGISSDPAMNWRVSELDNKSIVSFSDAHSLPNLGREATILDGEFNYGGLWKSIRDQKIAGTVEFFPEHGKYHLTGHRKCNVRYTPDETKRNGTVCPKCGGQLTVGVMERVEELASIDNGQLRIENQDGIITSKAFPKRPGFRNLVPLLNIISEAFKSTLSSQKVINEYKKLTDNLGGEIKILSEVDIAEIAKISGARVAEGIQKPRKGEIVIDPGYDGEYGVVKIWPDNQSDPQMNLFGVE